MVVRGCLVVDETNTCNAKRFRNFDAKEKRRNWNLGAKGCKSDVWSLGIVMLVLIGIRPYYGNDNGNLPTLNGGLRLPFGVDDIESSKMADFLEKCFQKYDSWSVNELLNVSVMGWRMMSSIHL